MKKINSFYLSLAAGALLTLGACSSNNDDYVQPSIPETHGLYILNEGNFGSSNASIGVYNFAKGTYETLYSNIGEVGNDMGRYGNKLYVVVNGGQQGANGKLLVYNIANDQKIGEIAIEAPRFIQFYKGKAYLTHGETGLVQLDTGATATSLPAIQKSITVGRTPEQLKIFKDKIYVANSGALSAQGGYDNRISVVNVSSFALDRHIEVADNINVIDADTVNNILYVNANTTYANNQPVSPSKLYAVNTSTDRNTPFTFGAEQFFITGTASILISSNKTEGKPNILLASNIQNQQFTDNVVVIENLQPYGINHITVGTMYNLVTIADAKNYTSNGDVYLYNGNLQLLQKFAAGIIPKKATFKN